jgi:hypothetical protein
MLDLLLHGDTTRGLDSLISIIKPNGKDSSNHVEYTAYESNRQLYKACHQRLLSWGFELTTGDAQKSSYFHKEKYFRVHLILKSFADDDNDDDDNIDVDNCQNDNTTTISRHPPDLIIGCCFADLFDPKRLIPDLIKSFDLLRNVSWTSKGSLVYFPITFAGVTQFLPPQPFGFTDNNDGTYDSNRKVIPSDTIAFRLYSRALENILGHNVDPYLLQDAMEDYGAELLSRGPSDWRIDPQVNSYLYNTMMYFFGSTGGPQILEDGWDARGWIKRARENRPSIQVINTDLLFRMPPIMGAFDGRNEARRSVSNESAKEILFTEPYKVTAVIKDIPTELGPRQILSMSW